MMRFALPRRDGPPPLNPPPDLSPAAASVFARSPEPPQDAEPWWMALEGTLPLDFSFEALCDRWERRS